MFARFSLKAKLLIAFLCVGIIPFAAIAVIAMHKAGSALTHQSFAQMKSMRDVKRGQVLDYLQLIKNQALTLSEDPGVISAMTGFAKAFESFRDENELSGPAIADLRSKLATYYNQDFSAAYREQNDGRAPDVSRILGQLDDSTVALQYHYIKANPNPLGSKDALERASDRSQYSQLHAQYHPVLRDYLQKFGYYDIFLVDSETGKIVYSVFKELDFATSLTDGPYAHTNFADAFRAANTATSADAAVFSDFKQYLPSYEAPAAFVASPIYSGGRRIGVLMFQFPLDSLNHIMTERAGMGKSGETYLVGHDLLMRSDSYLDPQNHSVVASFKHPGKGKVDTGATRAAFKGQTDEKIILDYNGNPVLSAYAPLDFEGLHWALLAEIDEDEAFAAIAVLRSATLLVAAIGIACIVALALLLTRAITRPIRGVVANLTDLAQGEGDLSARLPVTSRDEIGQLAQRFNEFMDKLHTMIRDISQGVDTLAASSTELSAISQQVADSGGQMAEKSKSVGAAAGEMSTSMSSVSAAMEQSSANTGMWRRRPRR
jgi:methyl-accepting chemotaxis protein